MNETRYTIRNDFWFYLAGREHTLNVSKKVLLILYSILIFTAANFQENRSEDKF